MSTFTMFNFYKQKRKKEFVLSVINFNIWCYICYYIYEKKKTHMTLTLWYSFKGKLILFSLMNTSYVIFCSLTSVTRFSIPTNVTTIRTITVKFVASFILEAVFAAFVHTVLTKRTIAASCKVTQRTKHRCFQIYIHFSF